MYYLYNVTKWATAYIQVTSLEIGYFNFSGRVGPVGLLFISINISYDIYLFLSYFLF